MGLSKKTISIAFVVVMVVIIGGVLLGVLLPKKSNVRVELEVWPHNDYMHILHLIKYQSGSCCSVLKWAEKIDDFLRDYRKRGICQCQTHPSVQRVACNATSTSSSLGEEQVCDVPVDEFHPCTPDNQYNYKEGAPCVFLKLNKILDWEPQTYNSSANLPVTMPEDLKQHITNIGPLPEANTVWVSCEGENPADKENIGPVQYIPRRGFPAYYYPFTNKNGYLSPLVAVLFQQPKKGAVVISVVCTAWAKNIVYENGGSWHFKLMVE